MYVREGRNEAEEGTRLVLEVARETGIHDTPISRSAARGFKRRAYRRAAAPPRRCIRAPVAYWARNYGGSLARSWTLSLGILRLAPLALRFSA